MKESIVECGFNPRSRQYFDTKEKTIMREILFRAKRLDNSKWVEGYYVHLEDSFKRKESHRIYKRFAEAEIDNVDVLFYPDYFEIDPASLGEYTGLDDISGKRIFEGDIVRDNRHDNKPYINERPSIVTCESYNCSCCYGVYGWRCIGGTADIKDAEFLTVIGNIHDNPDIAKEI